MKNQLAPISLQLKFGTWTVSERYPSDILDKDGFRIIEVNDTAILEGYAEKLGIRHWGEDERASREVSETDVAAIAQLIAAAPEMHELLQGFAYMVAAHGESEGFRIMQRRAQEVLAKAEGRQ